MSPGRLSMSDAIVVNTVGLLLMPETFVDREWQAMLIATLHDHLPACDTTHSYMGPLIRQIPRAWPKEPGRVGSPNGVYRTREAWVALQKWRLGEAMAQHDIQKGAAA